MFDKARLIAEIVAKDKRLAAYATLVRGMEYRLADASKKRDAHDEAVRTLQSERIANSILTAENASLEKDAQRFHRLQSMVRDIPTGDGGWTSILRVAWESGIPGIYPISLREHVDATASKEPSP